jgi:hypothetical protein
MYYKSEVGKFKEWGTVKKGNSKIGYVEGDTYKEKVMKIEDVLTKEDEKIFFGKNNCFYRTFDRFYNDYKGEKNINISDKNVCYNVDRFEDLKDIMDCGYATITGKYKNKSFVLTNCVHILDKNADELFKDTIKIIGWNIRLITTLTMLSPAFWKWLNIILVLISIQIMYRIMK